MKKLTLKSSGLAFVVLLLTGSIQQSCTEENLNEGVLLTAEAKGRVSDLKSELQLVRKHTAKFHSFDQAEKEGYAEPLPFNPSPYIPYMGFHYINVGKIDATFDMTEPEILLYVPNEDGELKLVGIEYAVPMALSPEAPEGFSGDEDEWEANPNVAGGSWTLHVWLYKDNPNGIFASQNPDVPVSNPAGS